MKFKFLNVTLAVLIISICSSANAGLIQLADFDVSATTIDFSDATLNSSTYTNGIFSITGGNITNNTINTSIFGLNYSTQTNSNPGVFRLDFSSFISAIGMNVHYNSSDVSLRLFDINDVLLESSLSSPTQYSTISGFVGLNTGANNIAYALIDVPGRVNIHDLYMDNVVYQRVTDVPEPSTLAIFALGMMGLASRRFKKQS
ncbi:MULTISPECIES: PEP-CTERM sorting domain-containing protein [unclassified Colwellia]|uniref:PEP-CTERM sorting domain-containing protein n=1 Tax=unclassified Colwellia TaxID=196834 RepID=UPI002174D7F1|nr:MULTISPECIES: PEP-CTERM sorting domain-containing protein [unclassified Colwellia]